MSFRIAGLALLIALAVLAWCLWPEDADVAAPPRPDFASATPDVEAATAAPAATNPAPAADPPADDAAHRVEVANASTWIVKGRAVRAPDKPAPRARVRARAFQGTAATGEPVVEAHLVADDSGDFVWSLEPPAELTFLELRGEGARVRTHPETFVVAPGDPPPPSFDLWVIPLDAKASGRVLDPQDRPIAGARVGPSWSDGVRTDDAGYFELPVERKASVALYATARGFVQLRQEVAIDTETGEGGADLRLRVANRIHGRVTDGEQRPIAGATLRTFYTIYAEAAETDAEGRYVLDNLDPSLKSHSLFARRSGYVEAKVEVAASGPDVECDLVMERGVEVRGIVVGARGQPLPAATVFFGFSPSAYDRKDAVSGLDGGFVFECVAAGEQTLNVARRGYAEKRMQVTVPKPPAAPVVVRVELEAGHFVGGIASGADGRPVAGVSIVPKLNDQYLDGTRGKTDAQGRFRLDGLPQTGLSLEFYGGGVLRLEVPVATVDRDDLVVALERHGRMAGTVVDGRTGKPITRFRIRFGQPRLGPGEGPSGGYAAQWLRGGKIFHDAKGVFRIDDEVRVGSVFALEASAEGYGATVDDHVVAALEPDPTQLVIALHPGVAIEGVVRERDSGLPIAGARLKAFASGRPLRSNEPNDDEGRPIAVSDERGLFRLDNVGPGAVSIAVEHTAWLSVTHGPIQVAPGGGVPPQEVLMDDGAVVTVDVRNKDGTPMAAELMLIAFGKGQTMGRGDATGAARMERVAPGDYELILLQGSGARRVWAFRRRVTVGHEDRRVELVASDGDATLVVTLDAPEALPDGLQFLVMPKDAAAAKDGAFIARNAFVHPGRTTITGLPAMELRVMVIGGNDWNGNGTVKTLADQTVELRVSLQKSARRSGR